MNSVLRTAAVVAICMVVTYAIVGLTSRAAWNDGFKTGLKAAYSMHPNWQDDGASLPCVEKP